MGREHVGKAYELAADNRLFFTRISTNQQQTASYRRRLFSALSVSRKASRTSLESKNFEVTRVLRCRTPDGKGTEREKLKKR